MEPRVAPLAEILCLNTALFRNCLDDLTEDQAAARPSPTTNSAAFVAAHVANSRFFILRVLGQDLPSPLASYLEGARGIDDLPRCPALVETQAAWTAAADALERRLATLTRDALDAEIPQRFPGVAQTVLGALSFLVQHESYHVGQLALLRKYVGLPAMRYT